MAVDLELWLATLGRSAARAKSDAALFARLKFVAELLCAAGPEVVGPCLLWRNREGTVERRALGGPLVFGRGEGCDVVFDDPQLSRRHCRFTRDTGGILLEDLGSSNGTWVNEQRVRTVVLANGDVVRLGTRLIAAVRGEFQGSQ